MKNSLQILKQFGYIPITTILIPSKSKPNEWHKVSYYEKDGNGWWECDCMSYAVRRHCRHIDEANKICQTNYQNLLK